MLKTLCLWMVLLFSMSSFGQITASPQAICNGVNVVLTIPLQPVGSTYQWQDSTTVSVSFTNVAAGGTLSSYTTNVPRFYRVIVVRPVNIRDTIGPIEILTATAPVSNFTFAPNTACSGIPVVFTNSSSPGTYAWNFGDGTTSTLQNPTHVYSSFGCSTSNFTTTLTVTNALGCTATSSNVVVVKNEPSLSLSDPDIFGPFTNCENNPTAANPNFTIILNNTSASAACVTSYSVNWGDGNSNVYTSANFPITHTYTQLGAFSLTLNATGSNGCSSTKMYTIANQSNPAGGLGTLGMTTNLCAPSTIPFIISNWANNSPGTKYILNFGDGTSVTLFHPLNLTGLSDTVYHQFTTSSCPLATFTAQLLVINACDTTPYTAGNVQIRIAPAASFTVAPPLCINQPVCFTNTTVLGTFGANCLTTTAYSWNFGDPASGVNNTSTASNPCHTFTSTGTYIVTLTSSNPCGPTTFTKIICISAPLVPSFTVNTTQGCSPLTVATTNVTDESLSCGTVTYNWTVSYVGGFCNTSSLFSFTNSTNANSAQPSFSFINSGTYTITLAATNSCGTVFTTKTIIVKKPPIVTLNPLASFCTSASISPVANVANCGNTTPTYNWSFPGGIPSTSNTLSPGNITYSTPGTYIISLSVTNECGTTTTNTSILIKEVPLATLPSDVLVCSGVSVGPLLLSSSMAGSTFTWTNSNILIGLAASGSGTTIPLFNTVNAGSTQISGTINVTVTNNLCSSNSNFIISVNPKPLAPSVISPINYCLGATATSLTATTSLGNTLLWYSTPTGGSSSTTAPVPNTSVIATTTYYVSQVNTLTNCEGPRAAISVTVNPVPAITATSTSPTTCGGTNGNITISGLNPSTSYTVNYIKNGTPVTVVLTSNGAGVIVINGLNSGTYTNVYVVANGCPSTEVGPFTLSDPSQPATPTAGSNSPLCSSNTINFTAASTTVGVTYLWSGPGAFSSTSQNPSITNATLANAGNYFVTASLNGCTSLAATVSVVVNPTPVLPTTSSNAPICANNNLNIFSNTTTTGTITYAWTSTTGFTSTSQNPIIPNAQTTNSGTYTVVATATTNGQACPSQPASITVVVKPVPVITLGTVTNPINCSSSTGSIQLNVSIFNTTFLVNYTQNTIPQTATFASNASGILIIPNLTSGVYDNFTVSLTGCISNMVGPITLTDPNPPVTPVIPAVSPLCSGNSINLFASTTSTGAATYLWTGPAYTSGIQNPVIPNATVANSGTYSVVVTIAGCASASASVNVLVNQTPATPSVTSNSPVCTNNTLTLSAATSSPGAMTYAWTGPNGFTSTLQNPTISNVTTAAAGVYNVVFTATTGNCPSAVGSNSVVIFATPAISNGTITNPSACGSATGSINLNGLLASTFYTINYTYNTIPQTATGTTNATGVLTIANLLSGTYNNFTVTLNGCVSNIVGPFTLVDPNPPIAPIVVANNPLCAGATLNLSASTSSGAATYQWSGPNGFNSTLQNPSIVNIAAINAGTYAVIATISNCPSAAGTIVIVVNPQAMPPQVTSPINYCIGTTASALTATASTGHTLNWYNVATGGVVLASAPTPSTGVVGSTFYYVSQTTALGCEGPRSPIEVKINPDALAVFVPTDTMKCAPFAITPAIIGLQPFVANNGSYEWYANNVLIGTGIVFPGYTITNGGDSITIKLKTISPFGCKADSMSRKFYTFKIPVPSFTLSDTVGCGPIIVSFVNTTPDINLFTYNWIFGNGITSTLQQPGTILFATNPNYSDTTYIIKLKVATVCDTITFQKTVRVKSKPRALYTPSITAGCSPMRVKFTNTSLGLNNIYYWNFDDGTNLTTTSRDTFTHIFTTGVVDTFRVKLVVVNDCGADSITYLIIAQPNNIFLNFSVNGTQLFGCAPHVVAFINNSVGGTSFIWNFGDGNTLSTTNNIDTVYHTYAIAGTFTAVLQAINSCTDTAASKSITVYPKPVPLFIASSNNVCIGQSVQFTNQSTLANSYSWNFGDGTFSTLISPSHSYSTPGLYTVMLTCIRTNPSGNVCIDSFPQQIQVSAGLPGLFSVQNAPGLCAPHTVTFVNRNVPSVTTLWNFGDGTTGTGDSVLHTYNIAGVYTVSLVTTVPGGCTYTSQQVVTISGPGGTLQYVGGYKCFPNGVSFIANVTNTDSIRWNFGDGTFATTTSNTIFHNYAGPGTFLPSASFINIAGCNFSVIGIDTIKVDKIDSGFVQNQQKFCGYTNVLFTDTSVAYFGKQLVKWRFGDGGIGTGSLINHTYTNSGIYNVEMIVIGNSGCSDTTIKQLNVSVNSLPVAAIIGPVNGCTNNSISFSANVVSEDAITNLNWLLSNGASGTGLSFAYNFSVPGIYTLKLFAGTAQGCFDTATHIITINPSPIINATNSLVLCKGNSVQLNVVGTSNYQWSPIQGLSCTTCPNPIASPLITTPYFVTGTNSFGCTAIDTVVITVIQPTQIITSGNTNICIGDTANLLVSGAALYTWTPSLSLSNSSVSNPLAFPSATTTYRVVGYDGYNCFTDTAFVTVGVGKYPTVSLGPDVTLAAGTQLPLATQIQNGPIQNWLWNPTTDLSCATCSLPIASIKKDITYIVKVTTAFGCSASDTINIKVFCTDAQVFIPNGFSPDGDGLNDILMVRGKGIVSVKSFVIFNRWGEIVFERANFSPNEKAFGWDGKVKGRAATPDVFVYTAEVICENGTSYKYKGNISLIK